METINDNSKFQMVKTSALRIEEVAVKLEEDKISERTAFSRLKGFVSSIQKHWRDFEEEGTENTPNHNLEVFEDFGAEVDMDGKIARWRDERGVHKNENRGKNKSVPSSNQRLKIEVKYIENLETYELEIDDDKYELKIHSSKKDVQGVIALLYDLASKFGFEETVGIDKPELEDEEIANFLDSKYLEEGFETDVSSISARKKVEISDNILP